MKIQVRKDAQDTWLALSSHCHYTPDYQIQMIKQTKPERILPLCLSESDGESTFLYKISNMISLRQYYRQHVLDDREMLWIVGEIMVVADQMRRYLLDPDRLVFNPSCIFKCEEKLSFCYLPIYRKPFRESFHTLTEYFVRKLDYGNPDAIQTACRLHKYTMEENYDIDHVVQQVKKEVQAERWSQKAKAFQAAEQDYESEEQPKNTEIYIEKERKNSLFREKKKKISKWGEWENL